MQDNNCNKETTDPIEQKKAAIELYYFMKLPPKQKEKLIAYLKDLLFAK